MKTLAKRPFTFSGVSYSRIFSISPKIIIKFQTRIFIFFCFKSSCQQKKNPLSIINTFDYKSDVCRLFDPWSVA